jgi:hypothetical protein
VLNFYFDEKKPGARTSSQTPVLITNPFNPMVNDEPKYRILLYKENISGVGLNK